LVVEGGGFGGGKTGFGVEKKGEVRKEGKKE